MLLFLTLVGAAGAAVTAYNQLRRRDPDAADQLVRTMRQVSNVVVVIARGVIAALDALTNPVPRVTHVRPRFWGDELLDDE